MALAHSLLEGRQAGAVFVDDVIDPKTALVSPVSGFYFVFGQTQNGSFDAFVPELLSEHLVSKCIVLATSKAWRERLDHLFPMKSPRTGFTLSRELRERAAAAAGRVPPGFELASLNDSPVPEWTRGIDPWVVQIWGGPEGLVRRSFGFCVLHDSRIVSIAVACGIGGGEAEVEIGTVPEFRRQGLAELACRAFIGQCAARGLEPAWSCAAGNDASSALARKLGFGAYEEIWSYPLELPVAAG